VFQNGSTLAIIFHGSLFFLGETVTFSHLIDNLYCLWLKIVTTDANKFSVSDPTLWSFI